MFIHVTYLEQLLFGDDNSDEAVQVIHALIKENDPNVCDVMRHIEIRASLIVKKYKEALSESVVVFLIVCKQLSESNRLFGFQNQDFIHRVNALLVESQILKEFRIELTEKTSAKGDAVTKFITEEIPKLKMKATTIAQVYQRLLRLSSLLSYPLNTSIGHLLRELISTGHEEEAVLLSCCIDAQGCAKGDINWESVFDLIVEMDSQPSTCGWDEKSLMSALQKLSRRAVTFCNESDLFKGLLISRWHTIRSELSRAFHTNISYNLLQAGNDPFLEWKVDAIHKDAGLPLNASLLEHFSYCSRWCFDTSPSDEEKSRRYIEEGADLLLHLRRSSHFALEMSTASLLLDSFMANHDWSAAGINLEEAWQLNGQIVPQLISSVISEKRSDYRFALGVLGQKEKLDALKLLAGISESLNFDYRKSERLALVGILFCKTCNLLPPQATFKNILQRSAWGAIATEMGIKFKEAFYGDLNDLADVMCQLVTKPSFSVNNLARYCLSFEMDLPSQMCYFIRTTLLDLESNLRIVEDGSKLVVDHQSLAESFERVKKSFHFIENKAQIKRVFFDVLQEVSPYFYEVQLFLVDSIENLADELLSEDELKLIHHARVIIQFFMDYKRSQSPTDTEKDIWMKSFASSLPKISKFRLPTSWLVFKLDPKTRFKVLTTEFSLSDYRRWCKIGNCLGINEDNICIQTVQNAVKELGVKAMSGNGNEEAESEWNLEGSQGLLLCVIRECIKTMRKPMKAITLGHWLMGSLPRGLDRVRAAEMTLQLAEERCSSSLSAELEEALELIRVLHQRLQITHCLYKYRIYDATYLKILVDKGITDMIEELYKHPSVVERTKLAARFFPDINSCVEDIAQITNLDLPKVAFFLLDKWLPEKKQSANQGFDDDTITNFGKFFGRRASERSENEDEDNLLRCIYLSQSPSCRERFLRYLCLNGLSKETDGDPSLSVRALKCLLAVADKATVESLSKMSYEEILERIQVKILSQINAQCPTPI
jgi:hypothetical protein